MRCGASSSGIDTPDEVTEGELCEARDLLTCLTENLLSPPDIGLVLGSQ